MHFTREIAKIFLCIHQIAHTRIECVYGFVEFVVVAGRRKSPTLEMIQANAESYSHSYRRNRID